MKRKLIICSSIITLLLSCFSFPIFAEETVQDSSNLHTLSDGVFLDQYFYDNYDLIPYLESTGNQYINTGINANNNIKTDLKFSVSGYSTGYNVFFGTYENGIGNYNCYITGNNIDNFILSLIVENESILIPYNEYYIHSISIDRKTAYFDNRYITVDNDYSFSYPIYIFARDGNGLPAYNSSMKLYNFSIYDYSLNDMKMSCKTA